MANQDRHPNQRQGRDRSGEVGRRFDEDNASSGRPSQGESEEWGRHQPQQGGRFEDRYSGRGGDEWRGQEDQGGWRDDNYRRGRYETEDNLRTGGSYGGHYDDESGGRRSPNEGQRGRSFGDAGTQYGQGGGRDAAGLGSSGHGYAEGRRQEFGQGRQFGGDDERDQSNFYGQGRRQGNWDQDRGQREQRGGQGYGSYGSQGYGIGSAGENQVSRGGMRGQWDRGHGDMNRGDSQRRGSEYGGGHGGQSDRGSRQGSSGYSGSSWLGGGTEQTEPRQSFRGKGPKGYERSDERLQEMICERLMEDPHIDASEVSVQVKNREVTLEGTVEDRRTKYEIEELIEQCGGVKDVKNQLRVRSRSSESGSQTGLTGLQNNESNYGTSGQSGIAPSTMQTSTTTSGVKK